MISFTDCGYYGRFGNQMFQYASLLGFATYSEQEWGIPKRNSEEIEVRNLGYKERFILGDGLKVKYSTNVDPIYLHGETGELVKLPANTDLKGYFQSPTYFNHCESLVREQFSFKESIVEKATASLFNLGAEDCVSVHIRRGDYLKLQQHHPVLSKEYYDEAMAKFKGRKFLFISDDIEWCAETFGPEYKYSKGFDRFTDMAMMSMCDGHIIANSSFSWWGAWLGGGKTIAPSKWHGIKAEAEGFIPQEWERL